MLLRAAGAPSMPAGLLDRLAGLPMSAPLPPPRSGLPTALGADGAPVFVAYSPLPKPAGTDSGEQDRTESSTERPAHRRALLPVSILASAAAMVAAGTLGGSVAGLQSSVQPPANPNFASNLVSDNPANDPGRPASKSPTSGVARFDASRALVFQQAYLRGGVDRHHPAP